MDILAVTTDPRAVAAGRMKPEEIARAVTLDAEWWFKQFARIKTKSGAEIQGPSPNILQRRIHAEYRRCVVAGVPCLIMVLKPRQKGASTDAEAICYHHMRRFPGLNGALMGDVDATSDKVFEMFRRYAESDRYPWNDGFGKFTEKGNLTDEITLHNGSKWWKETAGSKNAGRSGTVQVLHMDEVAFYPVSEKRDPTTAVLGSFAQELAVSLGFATSTPFGASGWFYNTWNDAGSGWAKIFAAWFEFEDSTRAFADPDELARFAESLDDDERVEQQLYGQVTLEHLNWRRHIIRTIYEGDTDKFKQEFPSNDRDCLTGEARVGTSSGILKIEDVEPGMRSDHGVIVAKERIGVRAVFQATTRRGYRIRGTADHRVAIAQGFVGLADTTGHRIVLQSPVMATDRHVVRWTGFGGVRHAVEIDERWGAFLGYYMGDGSFFGDTLSVVSDKRDQDIVERLAILTESLFDIRFARRKAGMNGGAVELRASDTRFAGILKRLDAVRPYQRGESTRRPGDCVRRKVCVPEPIWRSSRPVVAQFLRWLFEADGWASKTVPVIKFFSKDADFASDVQVLLLAFGITSTIRRVLKNTDGKIFPGHEMVLGAREAAIFQRTIGFVSRRKNDNAASRYDLENADHRSRPVAFSDDVVAVKACGEEVVWDIQIDGDPVFGANGMLVHNCFLLSSRPRFSPVALKNMRVTTTAATKEARRGVLNVQAPKRVVFLPDDGVASQGVKIWEEPRLGCRYVLSVDTCRGRDQQLGRSTTADPDYHSAGVLRAGYLDPMTQIYYRTKVVAHHRSRIEADVLADIVAGMAWYYGNCLTIPELNDGAGFYLVKELHKRGINLYRREPLNVSMQPKGSRSEDDILSAFGWNTDKATKRWMIDSMVPIVRKELVEVSDLVIQGELEKFVVNKHGQAEAMPGFHDDCVMMLGLGLYNLGAATEFKPVQLRSVDLLRLGRDPRYMAPGGGWVRE